MNEQTQAERLTREIMSMIPDGTFGERFPYRRILGLITQATAELRAEVERLKIRASITLHDDDDLLSENTQLKDRIENLQDAIKGSHVLVKIAQEGREKAEAQVAALVEAVERLIGPVPNPELFPKWFMEVLEEQVKQAQDALNDTQATAAAHDARVREAAIRDCITKLEDFDPYIFGASGPTYLHRDGTIEALKSLLPNQQGEGV